MSGSKPEAAVHFRHFENGSERDTDDRMAKHSSHRICFCGGALDDGEPRAGLQGGRFDGLPASAPKLGRGVAAMLVEDLPSILRSAELAISWTGAPVGKTESGAMELEDAPAPGGAATTPCVSFSGMWELAPGLAYGVSSPPVGFLTSRSSER